MSMILDFPIEIKTILGMKSLRRLRLMLICIKPFLVVPKSHILILLIECSHHLIDIHTEGIFTLFSTIKSVRSN